MKKILLGCALCCLAVGVGLAQPPEMMETTKEHEWLKHMVGEWTVSSEMVAGPGQPASTGTGAESARLIGNFWLFSEIKGKMGPMEMTGLATIGYDPAKKKFVGTWVDSVMNHMWKYEGSLDATGKILTLEAEGPDMMNPGKMAKFHDIHEIVSKDEKIMRSETLVDGKWVQFMKATYKRKK